MYSQEDADRMCRERQQYLELIHKNIEYPFLLQEYRKEELDELVELMVDTICSQRSVIRIAGDDRPKEVVKSRLLKLDYGHIRYVLDSLNKNCSKIRNVKQYLLAVLYNAPLTINNYYQQLVNHDMGGGF
ncbi:MAG: hypothetical protein IJX66_06045 [Lachnospiraceae bacterium]|jgi:hypothetical protein|nr:hypothetical protein [Lachnospiraceae bacterium]